MPAPRDAALRQIAQALYAATDPQAGYASQQAAHATIVSQLRTLGLDGGTARVLADRSQAAQASGNTPLTPAMRAAHGQAAATRAAYLVAAAGRLAAKTGLARLDQQTVERRYLTLHQQAQQGREQAALRTDAAANAYGPLLGWNARKDARTTPECARADGRNYRADLPPAIGLPGLRHGGNCRCTPGPPHPGARTLPPAQTDRDASPAGAPISLAAVDGHHVPGTPFEFWHEWRPRNAATALLHGKRSPGGGGSRDLRAVRGAVLDRAMQQAAAAGKFDVFDRLAAESDRRDRARTAARDARTARTDARREQQGSRYDDLIAQGYNDEDAVTDAYGISPEKQRRQAALAALRSSGFRAKSLNAAARQSYRSEVDRNYQAAEDATRGHMLSPAGKGAGVDPRSLFVGPEDRARKYASPELREWWDQNGRPTFTEHLAHLTADPQAARTASGRAAFLMSRGTRVTAVELAENKKTPSGTEVTKSGLAYDPATKSFRPATQAEKDSAGKKGDFNSKHPRAAAGTSGGTGGQFVPVGQARNSDAAAAQKDKGAQGDYKTLLTGKGDRAAGVKSLDDKRLSALSKILYSYKSSDPKVVAARTLVAAELRRRGQDVTKHGALGALARAGKATAKATAPKRAAPKKQGAAAVPEPASQRAPATSSSTAAGLSRSGAAVELVSGDTSPFSSSKTSNWVAKAGGLPPRVRAIARAIRRKHPEWPLSRCIATAVNAIKYSAATGDSKLPGKQKERASTVAAHQSAAASWETKKARARALSRIAAAVELARRTDAPREISMSGFGGKGAPPFGKGAPAKGSSGGSKPNPFAKGGSPGGPPPGPTSGSGGGGMKRIKDLVAAYSKVPPEKADAYRKKVISEARAAGAMAAIPSSWLKGEPGKPAKAGGKPASAGGSMPPAKPGAKPGAKPNPFAK